MRSLSVVYDDGKIAEVSIGALKLPDDAKIESVRLNKFQHGIEFVLADGTIHDVAVDYITWLTDEAYRRQYPYEDIGPRIGANVAVLRKRMGMSQGELARAANPRTRLHVLPRDGSRNEVVDGKRLRERAELLLTR
jgi:hypothetical protein